MLKSAREEVLAEYADGLTFTGCGSKLEVYKNSRRLLDVRKCVVLYEVELSENSLFGAFTGEKEFTLADSNFTDEHVLELIDKLILDGKSSESSLSERFNELNRLFVSGKGVSVRETLVHL